MKIMRMLGLLGLSMVFAFAVQAAELNTTLSFLNLNTADGTNSTITVDGSTNDLSVVRAADGNDYVYSITYSGADFDWDENNDILTFDVRVAGLTDSVADHGLSGNGTTNGATATIGTTDSAVNLNINDEVGKGWTVAAGAPNHMDNGDTLQFTVENISVNAAGVSGAFDGFVGFRYDEDAGYGHGFVIGEGTGLFGRTWNSPGNESITAVTTLLLTGDQDNGNGSARNRWGVGNVDFGLTVTAVLEPGQTAIIGKDNFDGDVRYLNRAIVGNSNAANVQWGIRSRATIATDEVIDTSVEAGGVVATNAADNVGFLGTNKTDNVFAMYRSGGGRTLTYTFEIADFKDLNLSVDWAGSGDITDKNVTIKYYIDGGSTNTIFDVGRGTANWNETMDDGRILNRNNHASVKVNGVTAARMTDVFQSYNPAIEGTGLVLTLKIVMDSTVGGFGGFGMDNLVLTGTVRPAKGTVILVM